MLGIICSNHWGMSTLVGTAPNIVFSAFMQETYGIEFLDSMDDSWSTFSNCYALFGLVNLDRYVFHIFITSGETKLYLRNMLTDQGPLSKDEKENLNNFGLTALWMFRTILDNYEMFSGLTDAGIAIYLFIIYDSLKLK